MNVSKETMKQFARFFVVGVSNTLIDFLVYVALTRLFVYFSVHIYTANVIAFIIAATWSYYANRRWTFKPESKATTFEAARFYTSSVTAFFMNTLTLFIVVSLGGYDLFGKVLASIVSMVWNFSLSKLWVFNK